MSSQNFKIKNGLSVNGQQVIDGIANGYFNVLRANDVVITGGGSLSTDQFARNTANSAGIYANTGITLAQAAFDQANTSGDSGIDQYARNTANSAGIYANTAINNADSASLYANTGINNAASASLYANTAAIYANTAIIDSSSALSSAFSASIYANVGITLAQSAYNQGNSTALYANTGINNAASASLYANAGITLAQAAYNQANTGGTDQYARDTANSAGIYANTGITLAQAAYNQGNSTATVANTAVNNSASASLYANSGITLAQAAYNEANLKFNSAGGIITGNVTISGNNDLVITGNLFVQGNTVTTNTQSFVVTDPIILLASSNFYTDAKDIGFAAHYNNGTNAHTGFIRDYVTKEYYIFHEYTPELDANNEIHINDPSFKTANVHAGYFKGNVIANTSVVDGRDLYVFGTSAYDQANTATNNAATGINNAASASLYANNAIADAASASLYANTGITLAQSAFNAQNSTAIIANSALSVSDTATLTNKRITPRIGTNGGTTSGNITPTGDSSDQYNITGLTGTTNIQVPSGTPTDGQKLNIRIKDNGTPRTLTWVTAGSSAYRVIGVTLPTTTVANKTIYVGCVYNLADDDWDVVAVASEA